jgi:hypothetical protein
MRRIIQLLVLLILFTKLFVQDCDKYITIDEDKTTHSKTFSGNDFITILSNGDTTLKLLTLLINDQKTLILSLNAAKKIKCIDPADEIHFFFDDNTKYTSTGNQDFNCEGALSIYFGELRGNDGLLKLLVAKKVKAIRLFCRAGVLDVDLSAENSDELKKEINCLSNLSRK